MSDKVEKNKVVGFTYILKDSSGKVLDASQQEALEYLHGHDNIVPGLEIAITGLAVGDKKDVTVLPEDAYGLWEEELIQPFPKDAFPEDLELAVGLELETETDEGGVILRVKEIREDEVLMDGNHPLAGETLYFSVVIQSIRSATAEEIDHGHVHSKGHHHHH